MLIILMEQQILQNKIFLQSDAQLDDRLNQKIKIIIIIIDLIVVVVSRKMVICHHCYMKNWCQ